jgi:hypothetical protein
MKTRGKMKMAAAFACIALLGGAVFGGTADAKKKHKKGANSVTVSKTAATAIPKASATVGSKTDVPLVIGNKAKGKVVGADAPSLTLSMSGDAGALSGMSMEMQLIAPNGRAVFLFPPAGGESAWGPTTYTANSSVGPCQPGPTPPPPPCFDPNDTLGPPYAGTVGDTDLTAFNGIRAKGTWTVRVLNFEDTHAATLGPVSLTVPLKTATG